MNNIEYTGDGSENRIVTYEALPYQMDIFQSKKRRIFCGGGVGSGKTSAGSVWTMMRAAEAPIGVYGLIASNSYRQLLDSSIVNLFKYLNLWGIPHQPRAIPTAPRPFTVNLFNGNHYVPILCRSLENYELLSGIELGFAWMDETFLTERAAVELVFARDRDIRMPINQILLTTTLDDPSGWLHDLFVDHYDPTLMDVFYAPSSANAANLPPGYIDGMKRVYSKRMFERMVEAKWVSLEAGQIFYAFDKDIHVTEGAEFDPSLAIIWAHDFNISVGAPISSCLFQIRRAIGPTGWRPEMVVFDEIVIDSADTNDIIKEMESRGWRYKLRDQRQIFITGDSSGRHRDTRSKSSDYDLLAQAGYINQRVPNTNPPIRTRHNECNALLKNAAGDVRCYIHPRCKTLIKGLSTVQLKDVSGYIEKQTREQHVTSAWGYGVVEFIPSGSPRGGETQLPL